MGFDAQVIAAYGRQLLVRDAGGRELIARPFGRKLQIVCGDQVLCEPDTAAGELHVREVRARRTCLYRTNQRGGAEPVCANLSLLIVTLAPVPEPDPFLIDRYLCAASSGALAALLVLNKCELPLPAALRAELGSYRQLGYRLIECSVKEASGLDALRAACTGVVAAIVGQSGVGKSSLIGCLAQPAQIATAELARSQEGRHTTSVSRLYDLPEGGQLIDSPGVRDFAPALEWLTPGSLGFIEVARAAQGCRFKDCRHEREPGCAVRAALERGEISARRYESFRRLRRLSDTLGGGRGGGPRARS
ncbi:MAG TPA: ribosome small subunit-dependent GTPase A [Steroidobacteraceae bacterium]|nr:ribosome small subunit-dependent GTPase A [Steroidobacteraceae bacterium]